MELGWGIRGLRWDSGLGCSCVLVDEVGEVFERRISIWMWMW